MNKVSENPSKNRTSRQVHPHTPLAYAAVHAIRKFVR